MTSKERVLTAFAHREADRVPLGEMHIMSHVSSRILGREAITGEGGWVKYQEMEMVRTGRRDEYVERLKKDTLDVYRAAGLDIVTCELDPPKETDPSVYRDVTDRGWTVVDKASGSWARFVYEPNSDIVHEVDSLELHEEFPAVERHLDALEDAGYAVDPSRFESARYLAENAPDLFKMAKVPNLYPSGRSWITLYYEMMLLEPELTQRLCDIYLKKALAVIDEYSRIGIDCVMIGSDWAYNFGPVVSPELIRTYMIPPIREIVKFCHARGMLVLKHTDGNIMQIADDFFGMGIDAYQGIEPPAGMDLGEIKRRYGRRVTLMGNVDCGRTLPFGTREQIVEETVNCIRAAARGGGYILSSSNTIAMPIQAEGFLTMVEAAKRYGTYPISV